MATPLADVMRMRVSTRDIPGPDRTPYWREVFSRQMCRIEFEPLTDAPLDIEATVLALPGLGVGWCQSTTPARWGRNSELVKDGDDAFALVIPLAGELMRAQRGQDLDVRRGEGVGILQNEPASIQFREIDNIAIMMPRSALSVLVPDIEEAATRIVRPTNEAMRLLRLYLMAWRDGFDITDAALCGLAVTHIHDLIAMAIGATRDGAEVANGRGVRAARLKAVKSDIAASLMDRDFSLASVAVRQRITPRYVHMLFEDEGTTFSQFVLAERLARALRLLSDVRYAHWSISAIAYACGFGDLSYFNRTFKRRFGATPSEVRQGQTR